MHPALLVFIGGGLGAITRYAATVTATRWISPAFPWSTLIVNLTGCFLIGLLTGLAGRNGLISPAMRLFLAVGFLGGLTTFSTYGMEAVLAARTQGVMSLFLQIAAHNLGGLLLVAFGMMLTAPEP